MSLLKLNIIGHIGQDAEIREVSGNFVISFSVAHTFKRKDKNNVDISTTTWVNCSYWRDSRDKTKVATYLKKGTQVFIEGTPSVSHYTNKEGEVVSKLECKVSELVLLGSRNDSNYPSIAEDSSSYPDTDKDKATDSDTNPKAELASEQHQSPPKSGSVDDLPF